MTPFLLQVLIELNRLMIQLLQAALKHLRAMRLQAMRSKRSNPNLLGQELAQSLISQGLRSFLTSSGKAASGTGSPVPTRAGFAGSSVPGGPFINPVTQPLRHTTIANVEST